MYKRVETAKSIEMVNGAQLTPVLSLKDEYGGIAHIILDDHCYVLVLKSNKVGEEWDGRFRTADHWFDEAVTALRDLPRPSRFGKVPADAEVTEVKPGYSVVSTPPTCLDDFITRRGVLLRFCMEELHDRLKIEGYHPIAKELGEAVLTELEKSDEACYERPTKTEPESKAHHSDLPDFLRKAADELQTLQERMVGYGGLDEMERLVNCAKRVFAWLDLKDTVSPREVGEAIHKLIEKAGVKA